MTHEDRQAQLLDDYLSALQRNRNAPVPVDLEPDMAEFARMMLGEPERVSDPVQTRIWQDIQQNDDNPHNILLIDQERDRYMKLKEKNKRSANQRGWLPLVATAAVSVLVSLFLASVFFNSQGNAPASQMEAITLHPTATPINTVIASASPMSVELQPTVLPPNTSALSTATLDPFMVQATQLIQTATAQAGNVQVFATGIVVITTTPQPTDLLSCDFDGEFDFSINQNIIRDDDTLIIQFRTYNDRAIVVDIEIFGGFLTNDEYQNIHSFSGEVDDTNTMTAVPQIFRQDVSGTDYANGSYLIGIRLRNANLETLSSCSIPITFVD